MSVRSDKKTSRNPIRNFKGLKYTPFNFVNSK